MAAVRLTLIASRAFAQISIAVSDSTFVRDFDDLSSADTHDWGNKERLAVFDTDKLSRSNGPPQSWFLDNTGGPPYPGEVSFFGDQCFRGFDNGGRVGGGMLVYSFLNSMVYFPSEQWTW